MSDNPSIDPGTTPSIPVEGDDIGSGVIRQGVVVSWGAKDASARVTTANPLPVGDAGGTLTVDDGGGSLTVDATSLPLPTGAATSALQTSEQTLIGAVTETAPATDTASSGLNGRLQRIAQRLTSIIGVLPSALGANGGLKIEGVASGTNVPISGAVSGSGVFHVDDNAGSLTVDGAVAVSGVSGNVATTSAASSQADGHSVAIGSTTDAAATTTGSVIAQLRRIANAVAGTLTVSGTVTTTPPSNASTNIAQMNGVATTMGNGVSGTGVQRVTLASDSTGQINVVNPTATLAAATQVSVTATHGTILSAGTYKSVMFRNLSTSASSVFVGPATVTPTTGMEIKPGEFLAFGPGECPSNLIEGVCLASGTATLIVQTAS